MKENRPPSHRTIADLAGVSSATVSRALKKDPRLLPSTVARIEQIADELGYRRNPELSRVMSETASSRYRKTGETIVCVVTRPTPWDSVAAFFGAMTARGASYGFTVEPFRLFEDGMSAARANQILWARGTAGLIVLPPPATMRKNGKITLPIEWDKFCAVEVDDVMTEPVLNRVRHNHLAGIWRALEELEILGYRRIGLCLMDSVEFDTHHRWTAGYLYWSRIRGFTDDLDPLICPEFSGKAIERWIGRQKIDAVIAPGVEVLHWMRQCGIRVPEEVGYASLDLIRVGAESVTGIDQRRDLLWSRAVDLLVTGIHHGDRGAPDHPSALTSPGEWHPGASCRQLEATPLARIEDGLIYPHGEPGARRPSARHEKRIKRAR